MHKWVSLYSLESVSYIASLARSRKQIDLFFSFLLGCHFIIEAALWRFRKMFDFWCLIYNDPSGSSVEEEDAVRIGQKKKSSGKIRGIRTYRP